METIGISDLHGLFMLTQGFGLVWNLDALARTWPCSSPGSAVRCLHTTCSPSRRSKSDPETSII